jgi:hypothetical protein
MVNLHKSADLNRKYAMKNRNLPDTPRRFSLVEAHRRWVEEEKRMYNFVYVYTELLEDALNLYIMD